jgi:DNA repair protein RadA/Sms
MKTKSLYVCSNCGGDTARWAGKCPHCGAWNSLVEESRIVLKGAVNERAVAKQLGLKPGQSATKKPLFLDDIAEQDYQRLPTGIAEFDRVLGGGITPGSITLIGGDPGIGKSTLMMQMCTGTDNAMPLYITGEESLGQIKMRADRMKARPKNLRLLSETNCDEIIAIIKNSDTQLAIIDSIQTLYRPHIESAPGSVTQVRECSAMLMQCAKETGIPVFVVGHVTKEGTIAGPRVLEHIVDTVLQFEGERVYAYRVLRAIKNRFGSTNEIGVFEMAETGLREVPNPSEVFLSERHSDASGTAVAAAIEGTRPILVEVQALTAHSGYGTPQRSATGIEYRRLQMILAVIEKRLGLNLSQHDVFVNIAGGLRLDDPAIDLAIAAAIVSSFRDIPLRPDTLLIGEIGLTGEVRTVSSLDVRLSEAVKLGFTNVIIPAGNAKRLPAIKGTKIHAVERIVQMLVHVFAKEQ